MWNISQSPQVRDIAMPGVFHLTEFSERSLQAFSKTLHRAQENSQPLMPIFIQSDGGSAAILFGFMSLMDSYREKGMQFAGVVSGTAASAGCCVFMYCDYRYMGKFSSLLFHSTQLGFEGNLQEARQVVEWHGQENDMMNEVLSKHLKKPKDWIKKQLKNNLLDDWLITSEKALELGIATSLSMPEFNLIIRSEFSIT